MKKQFTQKKKPLIPFIIKFGNKKAKMSFFDHRWREVDKKRVERVKEGNNVEFFLKDNKACTN